MTDESLRGEIAWLDGTLVTRGQLLVYVFGQCTAYRLQLFLYLKSCGHEELNTMNLFLGVDAPMPA